ncbi:MAG TPA: serine hydrolase domain-containing protein [Myxococcota bacterium]|nr:serine hydrolase domain-containing protein [Myxococcota bacterium]
MEIHGTCHPRYARVRAAFAEGFRARDEIGAAVAVVRDGETVVELWAGHADPARSRPWQRDTIVHMYSATKGMTALCAPRSSSTRRQHPTGPSSRRRGRAT